jgi:hypothetical protein
MSIVFQDGEPVDPLKLQKLQDQITAVSAKANQAFDLGSTLSSQQTEVIFHVKAGVESFENGIGKGEVKTSPIDLEWSGEYTNIYTVATPRLKNPGKHNIRISFSGDQRAPTMNVYSAEKIDFDLNIHWISVAAKPVVD